MAKRNVRARSIDGKKICYGCSKWKEESEFDAKASALDGLYEECRRCRARRRLAKYNMTPERYDEMVVAQNGVCAICLKPPSRAFDVDHDHACCPQGVSCGECIRGLLCFNCNSALGKLKDDVDSLKRAVTYLTQRSGNKTP